MEILDVVEGKRWLLILLGLAALAPSAHAALTGVDFTEDGAPLGAISTHHERLVTMTFTPTTSDGYVLFDLTGLHRDPDDQHANRRVQLSTCAPECGLTFLIMPPNATVTIPYRHVSAGYETRGNVTYTFAIDDTRPRVTGIRTGYCDEQRCYAAANAPTRVTITLEDETGSFDRGRIFFRLGSRTGVASNCTGATCTGEITIQCTDGQDLDLAVTERNGMPSQDDAGNPVQPGEPVRVRCDARPPAVINATATSDHPLNLIANNEPLTITAHVRELATIATMSADLGAIKNASEPRTVRCEKTVNDEQRCELTVTGLRAGRDLAVPLTFADALGQESRYTLRIPAILDVAPLNASPDFFTARATSSTPVAVNRVALQLAFANGLDYPYFVNYRLERTHGSARILRQELLVQTCRYDYGPADAGDPYRAPRAANWSRTPRLFLDKERVVFYPDADYDEPNRLDLSFWEGEIKDANRLENDRILVACNLSLAVEEENVLYENEVETLYFPVTLRNSALGAPGERFLEKIAEEEESLNGGVSRLIGYADTLMSTFAHLCQLQSLLTLLETEGNAMQKVGMLFAFTGAGQNVAQGGASFTDVILRANTQFFIGKYGNFAQGQVQDGVDAGTGKLKQGVEQQGGILRKMCDWVYCDTAQNVQNGSKATEWLRQGDDGFAGQVGGDTSRGGFFQPTYDQMMSDLNTPDVSNSLIMSLATQCYGGVVHNLNKYRQIDCGYLACLKEQALDGASVAPCEEARGVKMCRFVLGEAFELPYVRVIKNLAANVNQVIQNPLSILVNKLNAGACANIDGRTDATAIACRVMKTISFSQDFQSVTRGNLVFTYPYENDLCTEALCEGDDCDRAARSLLEQVLPGSDRTGDQYRRQYFEERERRQRVAQNKDLIADIRGWGVGEELSTEMIAYAERLGIKDEEKQRAFFGDLKYHQGCDPEACINQFEFHLSQNRSVDPADLSGTVFKASVSTSKAPVYSSFVDFTQQTELQGKLECYDGGSIALCKVSGCESASSQNLQYCNQYVPKLEGYKTALEKEGLVACRAGTEWKLCEGNCAGDCKSPSEARDAIPGEGKNAALIHEWVGAMTTALYDYLRQEGYLDALFLSGWGEWGAELSADAADLLDPDEWQNNLCNPAGAYKEFTEDDGSVYVYEDGTYRPVLTFAGERLDLGERAAGEARTLYTASAVVISTEGDRIAALTLNPGREVLQERLVAEGNRVRLEGSLLSERQFTEVCVVFDGPFPEAGADRSYCRSLELDAYARGGVNDDEFEERDVYGEVGR